MVLLGQSGCIWEKVVFRQKWFYSIKSGSIRVKWLFFGIGCCFQAKWLYSVKKGCIRAKKVVFGQSGCIPEKVVVFGQM